jgi:hypothetical protein
MGSLSAALWVISRALRDVWDDLWTHLLVNLVWLASVFLVLPAPSATLALFYFTNRRAHGESADLGDFFGAFRRYWKPAWRWGLINAVLIAILAGDVLLTGRLGPTPTVQLVQGIYLALLGAWLLVQFYALPFLFEQQQPSVRQALRNGAVLLGRNLGFSLLLALLAVCVLFVGMLVFLLTLAGGGAFLAAAGNRAVINRLEINH